MRAHENNLLDNRCTNINLCKKITDLQNQQTIISTMLYYNILKKNLTITLSTKNDESSPTYTRINISNK